MKGGDNNNSSDHDHSSGDQYRMKDHHQHRPCSSSSVSVSGKKKRKEFAEIIATGLFFFVTNCKLQMIYTMFYTFFTYARNLIHFIKNQMILTN